MPSGYWGGGGEGSKLAVNPNTAIPVMKPSSSCSSPPLLPARVKHGRRHPGNVKKLLPAKTNPATAFFGASFAMNDRWTVAGASSVNGNKTPSTEKSSAVYVLDRLIGAQIAKIVPADAGKEYNFGYSLAAEGGLLAVGSPAGGPGAVHVYQLSPSVAYLKQFAGQAGGTIDAVK